MNSMTRIPAITVPFVVLCLISLNLVADSSTLAQEQVQQVQAATENAPLPKDLDPTGKWERTQRQPQGTFRFIKEHRDQQTRLTITDAAGNVVQEKTSAYSLSRVGNYGLFTYYDNKIIRGRGQGELISEEQSYLYRIQNNQFFEIRGLEIGGPVPVTIIVWTRLNE